MTIIKYTPDLVIRNVDQLPKGGGCKYLEVVPARDGAYIAKQWRRKIPAVIEFDSLFIEF